LWKKLVLGWRKAHERPPALPPGRSADPEPDRGARVIRAMSWMAPRRRRKDKLPAEPPIRALRQNPRLPRCVCIDGLIEEINLSALEKLPEDEMRAHIQQLVTQYIVVERLALNTQELNEFVSEILDEMTGLGPLEPLLKDPSVNDILINGHESTFVERHGPARAGGLPLQGRGASAAHHQQDRLGGRAPCR
jgi:hypothetical protein